MREKLGQLLNDAGYAFVGWESFDLGNGTFINSAEERYEVKSANLLNDEERRNIQNMNHVILEETTFYIFRR